MARKKEFIKKSEARIIIYLTTAAKHVRNGSDMCKKLEIDYIYLMKLLRGMYDKGWVGTHYYDTITYFHLTAVSPVNEANKRLMQEQLKIKTEELG